MTLYKEDKATKKNRFIAIAMAGAMMSGAFAVAVPVLAEDTTIKGTLYTLVIPTSVTVTDASGFNALEVYVKSYNYTVDVAVTATSTNDWKLKSSGDTFIEYGLYDSNDSTATATEHKFNYSKVQSYAGETWNCGIKLIDYSNSISAGTYTDTITWTATGSIREGY